VAWRLGVPPNSGGKNLHNETRLQESSFSFCIVLGKYREFSFYYREGERKKEWRRKNKKKGLEGDLTMVAARIGGIGQSIPPIL